MRIIEQFSVSLSPQEVFNYVAVNYFENHPRFDPEIVGMINHTKGAVAQGTMGSEIRKFAGRGITLDFEVTDFKPFKLFAFKNTSGPFYLERSYKIEPITEGTRITFVFDARPKNLPVKLIFPFLSNSFRKNVHNNIQFLQELLNQKKKTRRRH